MHSVFVITLLLLTVFVLVCSRSRTDLNIHYQSQSLQKKLNNRVDPSCCIFGLFFILFFLHEISSSRWTGFVTLIVNRQNIIRNITAFKWLCWPRWPLRSTAQARAYCGTRTSWSWRDLLCLGDSWACEWVGSGSEWSNMLMTCFKDYRSVFEGEAQGLGFCN